MSKLPIKKASFAASLSQSKAVKQIKINHTIGAEAEPMPRVKDYQSGKKHLHIQEKRGDIFHDCSSMHDDYICCNVKVLATVSNCPYECSYCFLQNYLTDSTLSVIGDIDAIVTEVKQKVAKEPWRLFRIGTWELGDSVALESLSGTTSELVEAVADINNVLIELRTKSDDVASLLNLNHKGRTVVSWTVNPQEVVKREEYRTASIAERIAAMKTIVDAGYPVALHFDPMIHYPDWREGYRELLEQLFAVIPPERLTWVSIGSLRFNPEMKKIMESNYPGSHATRAEMVLGDDGKVRYIKPLRVEMYQFLYELLQRYAPEAYVYLCMERWDVWQKVLGWQPESTQHNDFLMAENLYQRFPELMSAPPLRELYESSDNL